MARPTLKDAPLLLARYRPLRLIARGGSSSVFQGRDETLGRDIAIKLFNGGQEADVEAYRAELRVLASLSHHGVVSIIDAGIDESTPLDPRPFLIMELVQGVTVREKLSERALTPREIGEIGYEVAEVLEYIHSRGVIHRDITPSNIMLVDYGTEASRPRARLTDFGIALDGGSNTGSSELVTGTVAYLSPEQVANTPLSGASDVYSLGLVLLECFTREQEYEGTVVEAAIARLTRSPHAPTFIDKPMRALLTDMTAREAADRPTPEQVLERLRVALRSMR